MGLSKNGKRLGRPPSRRGRTVKRTLMLNPGLDARLKIHAKVKGISVSLLAEKMMQSFYLSMSDNEIRPLLQAEMDAERLKAEAEAQLDRDEASSRAPAPAAA